jgi:hypothetical protein
MFDTERPGLLVVGDVVSLSSRINVAQDAATRTVAEGKP